MGIWCINYNIEKECLEEYIDWFESDHIPEKLSRPGYDWAAHYRVINSDLTNTSNVEFIAMFGSTASRTFYDPSPAQLKGTQTELTKKLIGYRRDVTSSILSQEWIEYCRYEDYEEKFTIDAPLIQFEHYQASDEQRLNAWLAQNRLNELKSIPSVTKVHKFIGSSGNLRQCLIAQISTTSVDLSEQSSSCQEKEFIPDLHKMAVLDWPK